MKTETYERLSEILKRYDMKTSGKIIQCLLGLSFWRLTPPPKNLEINLIEGIDIFVEHESLKYAIEVKTTTKDNITIGQKDLKGLEKYSASDYIPVIAVLKVDLHSNWIFKNALNMTKKLTWKVSELCSDKELDDLNAKVSPIYESLMCKHYIEIRERGLDHLLLVLKKENIRYSGT